MGDLRGQGFINLHSNMTRTDKQNKEMRELVVVVVGGEGGETKGKER